MHLRGGGEGVLDPPPGDAELVSKTLPPPPPMALNNPNSTPSAPLISGCTFAWNSLGHSLYAVLLGGGMY